MYEYLETLPELPESARGITGPVCITFTVPPDSGHLSERTTFQLFIRLKDGKPTGRGAVYESATGRRVTEIIEVKDGKVGHVKGEMARMIPGPKDYVINRKDAKPMECHTLMCGVSLSDGDAIWSNLHRASLLNDFTAGAIAGLSDCDQEYEVIEFPPRIDYADMDDAIIRSHLIWLDSAYSSELLETAWRNAERANIELVDRLERLHP